MPIKTIQQNRKEREFQREQQNKEMLRIKNLELRYKEILQMMSIIKSIKFYLNSLDENTTDISLKGFKLSFENAAAIALYLQDDLKRFKSLKSLSLN